MAAKATDTIFQELVTLSTPAQAVPCDIESVELFETDHYRWLCSPPGAIQCVMDRRKPERLVLPNQAAMLLAAPLVRSLDRVLDLGTGGGGFVRHLNHFAPGASVSCVEHDAPMLSLARGFFDLPADQPVHLEDGPAFLARSHDRYDLILCDLFSGRASPGALQTDGFYSDLARRVAAGGAVAINTLPERDEQLMAMLAVAKRSFPGRAVLNYQDVGNVTLFLCERELPSLEDWQAALTASPWAGDGRLGGWLERVVRV